ncbi:MULTISPECIES: ATP-binding protein [unclassified Arcicella]|uniref:ATP-binding protein n=1 Tax=unclassified Arcicella TaxID=2644986 RepID=UPI00285588C0|nr:MULTISPECIES: ATP-binding protein [unclassified Arcicella]MDR6562443.1 putative AAA+ superfamily ATPase [Arcicella sp. BE51]MDR6812337.1 putative AAA+ superfamily ATPase [Arcicella sp. BE140]MDR6823507.1 putative AAA+ superfamily ATPase [Arcicella sp. BE139]
MIYREVTSELLFRVNHFPVSAILGPRQVGKTTLVKALQNELPKKSTYFDLEIPSDLNKFVADPELFLKSLQHQTVILDEIHRLPNIFVLLRGLIDQQREAGRFILLGSASPNLLKNTAESLAGRISYLEMHPLHYREITPDNYQNHWVWGGFPAVYLAKNDKIKNIWLNDFLMSYLERDLPQLGLSVSPLLMRRLLMMLASIQGGILNYSTLANSLGISQPTVKNAIDFLEQAFIIRRLQPYFVNIGKRLVKSPKIYIRDSGLLHHLLNIKDINSLLGHIVAGSSWEGYIIQEIISLLPQDALPFYYRSQDGAELDLIIEQGISIKLAIEIKLSDSPTLSKGNSTSLQDIGNPPLLVVTPSAQDYELRPNIWVCSIATLSQNLSRFGLNNYQS